MSDIFNLEIDSVVAQNTLLARASTFVLITKSKNGSCKLRMHVRMLRICFTGQFSVQKDVFKWF